MSMKDPKELNMKMLKMIYKHSLPECENFPPAEKAEKAMKDAKRTFNSMRKLRAELQEAYESIVDNH